jgi:hypothetical protein
METITPWLPVEGTDVELFLETVARRVNGDLFATLSIGEGAPRTLLIKFPVAVAFRVSPRDVHMDKPWWGTVRPGVMFEVHESQYRGWLHEQSSGIYDAPYRHFMLMTVDGCLDVLTTEEPEASWLVA